MSNNTQLVLSLFPGIGMLDLAFEEEGFCCVRGPDVIWGGDIRRFHPPAGRFEGVIGGPPCQSFSSLAHLVRANGHEPKFGNLIPEFERCVSEAQPSWFVMENVPAAPLPLITGYGSKSFLLDNSALAGEGGFGLEQRRVRRFTFGMRGRADVDVPSLLRWIDLCVFLLPDATGTVFRDGRPTRQEARRRVRTVTKLGPDHLANLAKSTDEVRKRRTGIAAVGHGEPPSVRDANAKRRVNAVVAATSMNPGCTGTSKAKRERVKAVSSSNGGNGAERNTPGAGNAGKGRYRLADAIRLQGLPEGFLDDAPFTADGKLKAVANGVPIQMGRAIAKAVMEATR